MENEKTEDIEQNLERLFKLCVKSYRYSLFLEVSGTLFQILMLVWHSYRGNVFWLFFHFGFLVYFVESFRKSRKSYVRMKKRHFNFMDSYKKKRKILKTLKKHIENE